MPLARMTLSISQRCASKRRTCGAPRLSRIGGNPWVGRFIASLHLPARVVSLAGCASTPLSARSVTFCQRCYKATGSLDYCGVARGNTKIVIGAHFRIAVQPVRTAPRRIDAKRDTAMWAFLQSLLDSSTLSPHGLCLLWRPELIWLHVTSDAIIALAYFSIPFAISVFVMKRPDVQFNWVFWAFAIFIMACGMTHVMSIWTLWVPDYAFEGLIKAITAAASIMTAVMLWPLLPKVLALPSPAQLIAAH